MQAAGIGDDRLPWHQVQVIGVGQHHLGTGVLQLRDRHPLDRGRRADGHEAGGLHAAVWCVKTAAAGPAVAGAGRDL
jgi:hypothetical protein